MRLTFTVEEYIKLTEALFKHGETELAESIRNKFKKSLPSKEGLVNKQKAGTTARKIVENKNNKRVDVAIAELIRRDELITVTSVSKEAKISYNTANKYKIRIKLAASEVKGKKENQPLYH